jgi:hypothetical protein
MKEIIHRDMERKGVGITERNQRDTTRKGGEKEVKSRGRQVAIAFGSYLKI